MIDLRSDTLTLPTKKMLENIKKAELGDDGRTSSLGKGEDPTVNALEDLAARITGKESAILLPTGTMANQAAILAFCNRESQIAVHRNMHIFKSEKAIFDKKFYGMEAKFYNNNNTHLPDITSIKTILEQNDIRLLCIENTFSFEGGIVISSQVMKDIYKLAKSFGIPVFVDGARIFNASISSGESVQTLSQYSDAITFCLSKGLGAPIGSILCGNKEFIKNVRNVRKKLGGTMRQSGVIAAPGFEALSDNNIKRLKKDHKNAQLLATNIKDFPGINLDINSVQSNIVIFKYKYPGKIDVFLQQLENNGLLAKKMSDNFVRLTLYHGIEEKDIISAIEIIKRSLNEIS